MFLVFNYRWSFLKKKEITTQAESSQDDYYVKLLACNGFLKFEPMQSWQGSPEPILQRNISCLYFSHFVWILFGLFALFVGIFFCLSSKIVWSGNPDMATLESVGSTRVVVRTFAPSPQTLWRACQDVWSASCLKAGGRKFWPGGFAWLSWFRKTSRTVCAAHSPQDRTYFSARSLHVGAFTRKHSGCAWSIHWTSALFWEIKVSCF